MADTTLERIDAKIEGHQHEITRLRDARQKYVDLMAELFGADGPEESPRETEEESKQGGVTEAVLRMIRLYPHGIAVPDFITIIIGQNVSSAKKPERSIRNTIDYLDEKGRIRKANGKVFPVTKVDEE